MILESSEKYVKIEILRRSHPNSSDFWDANWLNAEVKINVSDFKGLYEIFLRSDDFERFRKGLENLKVGLSKEVEFSTIEEGIYLKGLLDITGNIRWQGIAMSLSMENRMTFNFETDNMSIDNLLNQVNDILNKYPVLWK